MCSVAAMPRMSDAFFESSFLEYRTGPKVRSKTNWKSSRRYAGPDSELNSATQGIRRTQQECRYRVSNRIRLTTTCRKRLVAGWRTRTSAVVGNGCGDC